MKDHFTASKEGLILYGENNSGGHSLALEHDGADVYIRSSPNDDGKGDDDDTKQCPAPV